MFGSQIKLFRILGFDIKIDFSWVFIALLIVWSLATRYFPSNIEGLAVRTYWSMAIVTAALFFASIIFHELAHSLVARHYDLKIKGITLFVFGGVAEMEGEPANARTEFLMALAGPAASLFLAGVFYVLGQAAGLAGSGVPAVSVFSYLAMINAVLGIFNLVPAFPLDGGRVFRAVMWHRSGDMAKATRTAAKVGGFFGGGLIFLGLVSFVSGNFVGGMWWVLIGLFVRQAAASEDFRADVMSVLGDKPVSRFMTPDPVTVPPDISVGELVENYFYRYHHDMFPVVENGILLGAVTLASIKAVPRDQWDSVRVYAIMTPVSSGNTVDATAGAEKVLTKMNAANNGRLMVVNGKRLAGVVALKDLLAVLSLKTGA